MAALRDDPNALPRPVFDGLLTRDVKRHAKDKFHYWGQISNTFARATSSQFYGRRACIDLFASVGVNRDGQTGELSWGSSLLALQVQDPFDTYVFVDLDKGVCATLATRARALHIPDAEVFEVDASSGTFGRDFARVRESTPRGPKVVVLRCDANHAPALVKAALPGFPNARVSLTLIDPCSASFSWHSLAALTLHERMDLMILFPEDMDIERNLAHEARLDAYFGCPTWRDAMQGHGNRGSALREFYKKRVAEELEFQFGDDKAVRASNGTEIYKFLFASKHRLGVKLWNETTRTTPDGQLALRLDC